jgi:PAS domain S-box-containing protein
MRIRTQFIIAMVLLVIILIVTAVSVIITKQNVEKASEQQDIATSIAQGASELSYLSTDYLIYRESQQLRRWQSRFASFSKQVASLNVDMPEQQALVRNIQANTKRLGEVFDSVETAVRNMPKTQNVALESAFFQVSWSRMAVQSQGLISDASYLSKLLEEQVDRLTKARTMLMYIMLGLFGALLLASYMLISRHILKSLAALQAGTAVIGSGNLDFKIEEKKNDEIGDLSRAFNQMTADLKTVTTSKADLEKEVTQRKQAEEDLRRQREWLRVTLTSIGDAVMATDAAGHITFLNPVAESLTGWQTEEALGLPVESVLRIIHEKTHAPAQDLVARVLKEKGVVGLANDTALVARDGREVPIEDSAAPMLDAAGNITGVVLVFRDVAQKRRAQAALRKSYDELEMRVQERTSELSEAVERLRDEIIQRKQLEETLRESETQVRFFASQCLTAQEDERKRVAGELHDSIIASLGAMRIRIDKIAGEMKQAQGDPESLQDFASKVTEINNEVRRIVADLRPSVLDDLGIIAAMSWFCREYEKTYSHISVEKRIGISESEVPEPLKTPIFRISQEAMNNIAKHSQASLVSVDLQQRDSGIELTIQDNGKGFHPDSVRKGLGLSTMRERAQLSGGAFGLESASGKGTIIRVSWPLQVNG